MGKSRIKGRKATKEVARKVEVIKSQAGTENVVEKMLLTYKRRGREHIHLKEGDEIETLRVEEKKEITDDVHFTNNAKTVRFSEEAKKIKLNSDEEMLKEEEVARADEEKLTESAKKRIMYSEEVKGKHDPVMVGNVGGTSSKIEAPTNSSGFRKKDSRRKGKPHRAAEPGGLVMMLPSRGSCYELVQV